MAKKIYTISTSDYEKLEKLIIGLGYVVIDDGEYKKSYQHGTIVLGIYYTKVQGKYDVYIEKATSKAIENMRALKPMIVKDLDAIQEVLSSNKMEECEINLGYYPFRSYKQVSEMLKSLGIKEVGDGEFSYKTSRGDNYLLSVYSTPNKKVFEIIVEGCSNTTRLNSDSSMIKTMIGKKGFKNTTDKKSMMYYGHPIDHVENHIFKKGQVYTLPNDIQLTPSWNDAYHDSIKYIRELNKDCSGYILCVEVSSDMDSMTLEKGDKLKITDVRLDSNINDAKFKKYLSLDHVVPAVLTIVRTTIV